MSTLINLKKNYGEEKVTGTQAGNAFLGSDHVSCHSAH